MSAIGFREALLLGGCLLLSIGLGIAWLPLAALGPGIVLVYVAIAGVA